LRAVFVQFLFIKDTRVVLREVFFFTSAGPAQEVDNDTSNLRCDVHLNWWGKILAQNSRRMRVSYALRLPRRVACYGEVVVGLPNQICSLCMGMKLGPWKDGGQRRVKIE